MIHVTDHDAQALARRAGQYKALTRNQQLLSLFSVQIQAIEDALWQLLTERTIDAAVGEQLDVIGRIVHQPRVSPDDAVYRLYLKARIRLNVTDGTVEEIYSIFRLVVAINTVMHFVDEPTAGFVLRLTVAAIDTATAAILAGFVHAARAAGVRGLLESSGYTSATTFSFLHGPGLGFGAGHLSRSY